MLVAQRYLRKAGNDLSDRHPGDAVPEAYDWPNLKVYLQNGWLVEVADWQPADAGAAVTDAVLPAPPVEAAPAPLPQAAEIPNHTEASAESEGASSDLHKAESPKSPTPEAAAPKRRGRSRR